MREQEFTKPAEVRSRQERGFAALIGKVLQDNPFYRKRYKSLGFRTGRRLGLSDLAKLPLITAQDVLRDQQSNPPFGTNLTFPLAKYTRVHHGADGNLRWMDTEQSWNWWLECWKTAYEAAGVTPEHHVFVACAIGPSIGFWTALEAGQKFGALMIPGGAASPEEQHEIMLRDQADVLVTTPRNAQRLARAAALGGYDLASCSLRMILHSDEIDSEGDDPGDAPPWSGKRTDIMLSTELGAWAFGCDSGTHLHINEEEFVVEIIDPHSGEPVPLGQDGSHAGEMVLTNLGRVGSPLIRYRTGRNVKLSRQACKCGRRTARVAVAALAAAPRAIAV
ncbi:MAG: phenylacetate--CoA ligase family protein [Planctomycetota bacterium]|jgi:phenylacetate-CoA ligase